MSMANISVQLIPSKSLFALNAWVNLLFIYLVYITNRMLHMLAAARYHNFAKPACLYVQMIKT